jgi:putative SOS response-associated peptidase YedK
VCTSYETNEHRKFEAFLIFSRPDFAFRPEIYKDFPGAIIRRLHDHWSTDLATFGMVPRVRIPPHVKAYDTTNARAETIGEKRSFSSAWKRLQLCLIPCETFFELHPRAWCSRTILLASKWRRRRAGAPNVR